jgi:hypothetical protein
MVELFTGGTQEFCVNLVEPMSVSNPHIWGLYTAQGSNLQNRDADTDCGGRVFWGPGP